MPPGVVQGAKNKGVVDFYVAAVTVTTQLAVRVTLSLVTDAVMVAVPAATPVTVPLLTVATFSSDVVHVTLADTCVTVAV